MWTTRSFQIEKGYYAHHINFQGNLHDCKQGMWLHKRRLLYSFGYLLAIIFLEDYCWILYLLPQFWEEFLKCTTYYCVFVPKRDKGCPNSSFVVGVDILESIFNLKIHQQKWQDSNPLVSRDESGKSIQWYWSSQRLLTGIIASKNHLKTLEPTLWSSIRGFSALEYGECQPLEERHLTQECQGGVIDLVNGRYYCSKAFVQSYNFILSLFIFYRKGITAHII